MTKKIELSLLITVTLVALLTSCKGNQPVPDPVKIEKQWIISKEVDIDFGGNILKGKTLIDISVTTPGKFIIALQQKELALLLGVKPIDAFWYMEPYDYTLTMTGKDSGLIKVLTKNDKGELEEETTEFSKLTQNSVTFIGSNGVVDDATASSNKIELVKVNL